MRVKASKNTNAFAPVTTDTTPAPDFTPATPETAHPQTVTTPDSWLTAKSGTWATAADWSNGKSPTTSNDATIAVAGKYTVSITGTAAANSLTITDSMATLADTGTLSLAGSLAISAGTFALGSGGDLTGATITTTGTGQFLSTGGTLANDSYDGTLNLSAASANLTLAGGDSFAGANGTGAGLINLTGTNAALYADDGTVLNNALLNFGGSAASDTIYLYPGANGAATLTLGAAENISQTAASSRVTIDLYSQPSQGSLINNGTITAAASGGTFTIFNEDGQIGIFTNNGTIAVSNNDIFNLSALTTLTNNGIITVTAGTFNDMQDAGTFTNAGTITATGSQSILDLGGAWQNNGVISVGNGATANAGGTFTTASLSSIASSGGTVNITGDLINTGATYTAGANTLSGTITGGTVIDATGALVSLNGTLSGVSYDGTVNLSTSGATLTLAGTDTFAGASGSGIGTINLSGASADLIAIDGTVLNNVQINFGAPGGVNTIYLAPVTSNAATLTLGSGADIVQSATKSNVTIDLYSYPSQGSLINDGTITAAASAGTFTIYNASSQIGIFTNQGAIAVTNGDSFLLSTLNTLTNSGTISISGASTSFNADAKSIINTGTIDITGAGDTTGIGQAQTYLGSTSTGSWSNQGTIIVANGGDLHLGGIISLATFASITNTNGYLEIAGTLQNTGTLVVSAPLSSGVDTDYLDIGATIAGGTISDATGALFVGPQGDYLPGDAGTLSAVTYDGTLNITQTNAAAALVNGFTLNGANGTGAGTINLTGNNAYLNIADNETLANGTLNIGNAGNSYLNFYNGNGASAAPTLTLAASFTVSQTGACAIFESYPYGTVVGTIINNGTINAGYTNGQFTVATYVSNFTNNGTIAVSNADTFTIAAQTFGSLKSGTLTGSYNIGANSVLELYPNSQVTSIAGTVTLSGAGSTIQAAGANSTQITIDSRLATIATTGALNLLGGRNLNNTKSFIDNGRITLGGGTITETAFTIASTGTLSGFGKLNVAAIDNGNITAQGGTLVLAGAISGPGSLVIAANATLEAGAATTASEATIFNAQAAHLKIDAPTSYASVLSGFTGSDTIDFAKTIITSVSATGTTLAAITSSGSTINLALAAPLTNTHFQLTSDGASGTILTAYRLATASTHTPEPVAFGNHHVNDTLSTALTLTNTAPTDGFSESLDATIAPASGSATAAGSFTGLAAGASNTTSLTVGLNTSTAGAIAGTATINLSSDGTGTDSAGTTALGTQTVNVTGAIYNYAAASLANAGTVALGNIHVGSTASGFARLTNTGPSGNYTEALDASLTGAQGGITATGSVTGLAAGATNAASLALGYTAAAAGTFAGTATLSLASDGNGIDGLGTTTLASQAVTLTGTAYAYATPSLASTTITLAVTHVGATDQQVLAIANSAAANGYSESLDAGFGSLTGAATASGNISLLAAGSLDSTDLLLGLATSNSGTYSGTALLALVSDGAGTSNLGTTALATQTITVTGIVDNYALAAFTDATGPTITGTGTSFAINLGNLAQGAAPDTISLGALNAATGLSDLLGGTISSAGATGFTNNNFGTFANLSAGQSETAQSVTLSTSTVGTFTETVVLTSAGSNASGYNGALPTETLTITGTVSATSTTTANTYTLATGPNIVTGAAGGDLFKATATSLNSRDQLTGGNGYNVLQLTGAGSFDTGAPNVFANIPTILATQGQAAKGSAPNTLQTIYLRDAASETLTVAASMAASGNTNPLAITIYGGTGNDTITLAAGQDAVTLYTGTDTITLGGAANSITAGGGTANLTGAIATAAAAIHGNANSTTTLTLSTAGTATLNASDTYLTVNLAAATKLTLGAMGFITVNGGAGHATITAGGANQTLIGGTADTLTGSATGTDTFLGTSIALNADIIGKWTTGDVIDITDINAATLQALTYASSKLTVNDGTHSTTISFNTTETIANFTVLGTDNHGGTLIGFHG